MNKTLNENRFTVIISLNKLICELTSDEESVKLILDNRGITQQDLENEEVFILKKLSYSEATYIEDWFEDYRYEYEYIESLVYRLQIMTEGGEKGTRRYYRLLEKKYEAEMDFRNNELKVLSGLISKYNR